MHRIAPALDAPGGILLLDVSTDAPSSCVLARNADDSAKSARTHDSEHWRRSGDAQVGGQLVGELIDHRTCFHQPGGFQPELVGVL